jgi:hypothetical protein
MNPNEIRKILERDGLAEAERQTGRSYKESEFTQWLGFQNHLEASADRDLAMLITGDTSFSNTTEMYLEIATGIGFEIVAKFPFEATDRQEIRHEQMFILWNNGILLYFDTYYGKVNSGKFYYNWVPKSKDYPRLILSSGSWESSEMNLWSGYHDCREALKFHISELKTYGDILNPWKKKENLWLVNYADTAKTKGMNFRESSPIYKSINEQRISMLPRNVREAITPDCSHHQD